MHLPSLPRSKPMVRGFPRTFFGFTDIADKVDDHLIAALGSLEGKPLASRIKIQECRHQASYGQ